MASESFKKNSKVAKTAKELDDELDNMIKDMKKKNPNYKYEDGFTKENLDHILRTHPAFMRSQPTQEEIDDSPLLQGLQSLQYEDEDNTPEEVAFAYKEDGNWHFKKKLYQKAIKAYTEGLKKRCVDNSLNSTLLANRAAANFHLENYRSAIIDSLGALKLEPEKLKSMLRCAQSYERLQKNEEAITWLEKVLAIEPNNTIVKEIMQRVQKSIKSAQRDRRKREKESKLKQRKAQALVDSISKRGIKLDLSDVKCEENDSIPAQTSLVLSSINMNNSKVHFENEEVGDLLESGRLVWPVLFTYPEYQITEVVEEFHEDSTFTDHIEVMFDGPAPWDGHGCYTTADIEIYHESDGKVLHKVSTGHTLGQVLSVGKIAVRAGTPAFIVLSRSSQFKEEFLTNYKQS